jgi:hypothetical protein
MRTGTGAHARNPRGVEVSAVRTTLSLLPPFPALLVVMGFELEAWL